MKGKGNNAPAAGPGRSGTPSATKQPLSTTAARATKAALAELDTFHKDVGSFVCLYDIRLTSLRGACEYRCKQQWPVGHPLARLAPRKVPLDHSRVMTRDEVGWLPAKDVLLQGRVLRTIAVRDGRPC